MKIAGLIKTSLIDFPGNVAAVVFTQGCNFRCGFCHNPELLDISETDGLIEEDEVFKFLETRRGMLDGIVITGGEPTLQTDLPRFIKKIKDLGFKVKLDTNGTNPKMLEKLLDEDMLDYVAMDIKGKLSDYEKICGPVNISQIGKSIEILKQNKIPIEFRTTVLPYYHKISDFEEIGALLAGAKKFTVQGFRSEITYLEELGSKSSFSLLELDEIKTIMMQHVGVVDIHSNL